MVYRHVFYESNSRPWYRYWYRCVLRRNQPYSDFFKKCSVSDHPYFVGVQYHPEFTSRPIKPSPPYLGLLLASAGKLQSYLQKGCRLSPRWVNGVHLLHSPPVNGCSSLFFLWRFLSVPGIHTAIGAAAAPQTLRSRSWSYRQSQMNEVLNFTLKGLFWSCLYKNVIFTPCSHPRIPVWTHSHPAGWCLYSQDRTLLLLSYSSCGIHFDLRHPGRLAL